MSGRNVGVSQRNTVLNRNRRLLLWWSQQKKESTMSTYNLTMTNPAMATRGGGHGRIGPLDPPPPRTTEFATVTQVGSSMFLGSATLLSKGRWPQRPNIFRDLLYIRVHRIGNNNQILEGDQSRCDDSSRSTHKSCGAVCWRYTCIANLIVL